MSRRLGRWIMTYAAFGPLGSADRPRRVGRSRALGTPGAGLVRIPGRTFGPTSACIRTRTRCSFPSSVPDSRRPAGVRHAPPADVGPVLRPPRRERIPLPAGLADPRPGIWVSFAPASRRRGRPRGADPVRAASARRTARAALGGARRSAEGRRRSRIEEGWLVLHHGVTGAAARDFDVQPKVHYSAGALVLDAGDVTRVVARSVTPLLEPELPEEVTGTVGNVVFPTAIEPAQNGDASAFDVYYGMADRVDRGRPPVEDRDWRTTRP